MFFFYKRNVARNRAAIEAKKNLNPGTLKVALRPFRRLTCSERIIIVRGPDLKNRSFRLKKFECVFVPRPMKIVIFHRKNGETPKWVVDFPM